MKLDPPPQSAVHTTPVLTVGALSLALKHLVEKAFSQIRVRGEISGCKHAASGHLYFGLKDSDAVVDAVCWRTSLLRLPIKPCDGMDVIVSGRLTTFPSRSRYQIIVETIELAGEGALLKVLEDRRKALAAEGLFDESRKKSLPFLPDVIGIVTSPSGAVIRDMLHRFSDRFPRRVLLWPVQVQGQGAAEQVAAAINGFNQLQPGGEVPRPDVLIVARGGGSLEDLWGFNEEIVVRAAVASSIPVISAVGHETDSTLIDFASDRRAPTPTAAAEMAVPVRVELLTQVRRTETRLGSAVLRTLNEQRIRVEGLSRGLPKPNHLLDAALQRLDERAEKLVACFGVHIARLSHSVRHLAARLPDPHHRLTAGCGRLDTESRLLRSAYDGYLRELGHRLLRAADLLDGCSHERTLRRGYLLAYGSNGRLVTTVTVVSPGDRLNLRFNDGHAAVAVEATSGGTSRPAPRKPTAHRDDQGRLF